MHYEKFDLSAYQELAKIAVTPQFDPRTNRSINKPLWLKSPLIHGDTLYSIKKNLQSKKLHTVCEEAKCPNISECWNVGTATFMILGDTCTRACRFCHVKTGKPQALLDTAEPDKVAESVQAMGLEYAVITMVDRDDLPDGGAGHIAQTIAAIQHKSPNTRIEILAGDMNADVNALSTIVKAGRGLDVFAHNLETVQRLSPRVRDARAKYQKSLAVLSDVKRYTLQPLLTKSSLMLGLGEEGEEIYSALQDLRHAKVDIVTLGQYLQPTAKHLPVKRYVHPTEFEFWENTAKKMGFLGVAAGPLVRSSYKASSLFLPKNLP